MSNIANSGVCPLWRASSVAALSLSLASLSMGGASAAPIGHQLVSSDQMQAESDFAVPFQMGSGCVGRYGSAMMGGFASPSESPYTWDGRCRF